MEFVCEDNLLNFRDYEKKVAIPKKTKLQETIAFNAASPDSSRGRRNLFKNVAKSIRLGGFVFVGARHAVPLRSIHIPLASKTFPRRISTMLGFLPRYQGRLLLGAFGGQKELVLAHSDRAVEIIVDGGPANYILFVPICHRAEENSSAQRPF